MWGLGRHAWGGVHFWIAIALVAFIVLHVALHWAWVYASSRRLAGGETPRGRRPARECAVGLAFLALVVLLVAGFLGTARGSIVAGGADEHAPAEGGAQPEAGEHAPAEGSAERQ